MRMVLHAALSSEDVAVAAAGTDVLILMIYAFQSSCLNEDGILDTRMINVIILKQYALALLTYSFMMTSREIYI